MNKINATKPRVIGWWEEYRCGCVSESVRLKKDLLGYCSKHGESKRHSYKDVEFQKKGHAQRCG